MKARALVLDRDGVINRDDGYVHRIADIHFVPGIFDLVRTGINLGFRAVVVSNQSGIARGYFDPGCYADLTQWLTDKFAECGAPLTAILHCPYHPDGQAPFRRDSYWRKPNPGMILEAALRLDLDIGRSVLIGDQATDLAAARSAGIGLLIGLGSASTTANARYKDLHTLAHDLPTLAAPLLRPLREPGTRSANGRD